MIKIPALFFDLSKISIFICFKFVYIEKIITFAHINCKFYVQSQQLSNNVLFVTVTSTFNCFYSYTSIHFCVKEDKKRKKTYSYILRSTYNIYFIGMFDKFQHMDMVLRCFSFFLLSELTLPIFTMHIQCFFYSFSFYDHT